MRRSVRRAVRASDCPSIIVVTSASTFTRPKSWSASLHVISCDRPSTSSVDNTRDTTASNTRSEPEVSGGPSAEGPAGRAVSSGWACGSRGARSVCVDVTTGLAPVGSDAVRAAFFVGISSTVRVRGARLNAVVLGSSVGKALGGARRHLAQTFIHNFCRGVWPGPLAFMRVSQRGELEGFAAASRAENRLALKPARDCVPPRPLAWRRQRGVCHARGFQVSARRNGVHDHGRRFAVLSDLPLARFERARGCRSAPPGPHRGPLNPPGAPTHGPSISQRRLGHRLKFISVRPTPRRLLISESNGDAWGIGYSRCRCRGRRPRGSLAAPGR